MARAVAVLIVIWGLENLLKLLYELGFVGAGLYGYVDYSSPFYYWHTATAIVAY